MINRELIAKPQSFRMKQIDELIWRGLSNVIREEVDVPDDVFFTITKVITSKDLATAKVFYITQPEEKHAVIANLIKRKKKIINERMEEEIIIRKLPKFKFIFDQKELEALQINEKIAKLK